MIRVLVGPTTWEEIEFLTFPAGETHLKNFEFPWTDSKTPLKIRLDFQSNDDLINLLHFDQYAQINRIRYNLVCPYFPAARQDRIANRNESFSLLSYTGIIHSLKYMDNLTVFDPHSDVLAAVLPLKTRVWTQETILGFQLVDTDFDYETPIVLVAPDLGASKKIQKCASTLKKSGYTVVDILQAEKVRDYDTGNIVRTSVENKKFASGVHLMVVDDICDGGRTFIELGKVLKKKYPDSPLHLFVSHGIFSKGKSELEEYYDNINAYWLHPTYNKPESN